MTEPFRDVDALKAFNTSVIEQFPQYLRSGGAMIVVGAYAGADVDSAWLHNLRANPRAHVEVGTESFVVVACELSQARREHAQAQIIDAEPGFAEYQAKTSRALPVFELRPV